MPNVIEQ